MRERIFVPLNMSSRVISERDIIPNRAAGYERFDGQLENQQWVAPSQNTTADGSLYVSAQDMARWSTALDDTRVLSAAEKELMWTPTVLVDGRKTDYGFGWELEQKAGHRIAHHRGDWQGFTSFIMHLPDDRLTIAVLMNRANGQPQAIAGQIAGTLIHELRKPVTGAPSESDVQHQPVYVRGPASDGKPPARFVEITPGHWQSRMTLASGMQQFRIGDASGQTINLGARIDEVLVKPGQSKVLDVDGESLFLEVRRAGEYTFDIDMLRQGMPMLTVNH